MTLLETKLAKLRIKFIVSCRRIEVREHTGDHEFDMYPDVYEKVSDNLWNYCDKQVTTRQVANAIEHGLLNDCTIFAIR